MRLIVPVVMDDVRLIDAVAIVVSVLPGFTLFLIILRHESRLTIRTE